VAVTSGTEALAAALIFGLVNLLSSGSVDVPVLGRVTTDEGGLGIFAAVVVGVFFLRAALVVAHDTVLYRLCYGAGAELEEALLRGYLTLPPRTIRRRGHAELVRNVHDTVTSVVDDCLIPSVLAVGSILTTIAILAVMISAAPLATVVAGIVFLPVLWLTTRGVRRPVRRLGEAVEASLADSLLAATETLSLAGDIRMAGRAADFGARFGTVRRDLARAYGTDQVIRAFPRLVAETVLVLLVVGYVAVTRARGSETAAVLPTLGLFAYAALRVLPSLISLAGLRHSITASGPAVETILADEPLLRAGSNPPSGAPAPGKMVLQDVTVRLPETGRLVLDRIDLELRRGDVVALVGSNGAGKSTLVDVLAGVLPPDTGAVTVDGRPLEEIEESWPTQVALIPQHVHLLDADIPTNITLDPSGRSVDQRRLATVIEAVGLEPVIDRLGGQTVGEDGRMLSGGERQRVAVARAFYRSAGLLLVDEGTSALDDAARRALVDLVHERRERSISMLVTHDPELVRACTRVIRVEAGRLRPESPAAGAAG
jgi:ABC-type multidrug transport system fused ATPase/permease subunit